MTYPIAQISLSIKIISTGVLILNPGLVIVSVLIYRALISAALLAAITLGCYLRAPLAYPLSGCPLWELSQGVTFNG